VGPAERWAFCLLLDDSVSLRSEFVHQQDQKPLKRLARLANLLTPR